MDTEEQPALWPWVAMLVVTPAIVLLTFAVQSGQCASPTSPSDAFDCSMGPTVGLPGAIVIAVVCAAAFMLAVIRLVLRSRKRAGAGRTH